MHFLLVPQPAESGEKNQKYPMLVIGTNQYKLLHLNQFEAWILSFGCLSKVN